VNGEDKWPTGYNTNFIVMYKSTRCKGCKIEGGDAGGTGQLGKVILYYKPSNINMIFLTLPDLSLIFTFVNQSTVNASITFTLYLIQSRILSVQF
jgi:hypothetical protein